MHIYTHTHTHTLKFTNIFILEQYEKKITSKEALQHYKILKNTTPLPVIIYKR